jgi:hypothetical protein
MMYRRQRARGFGGQKTVPLSQDVNVAWAILTPSRSSNTCNTTLRTPTTSTRHMAWIRLLYAAAYLTDSTSIMPEVFARMSVADDHTLRPGRRCWNLPVSRLRLPHLRPSVRTREVPRSCRFYLCLLARVDAICCYHVNIYRC